VRAAREPRGPVIRWTPTFWSPTLRPGPVHRSHSFAVPCSVRPSPMPSPRLRASQLAEETEMGTGVFAAAARRTVWKGGGGGTTGTGRRQSSFKLRPLIATGMWRTLGEQTSRRLPSMSTSRTTTHHRTLSMTILANIDGNRAEPLDRLSFTEGIGQNTSEIIDFLGGWNISIRSWPDSQRAGPPSCGSRR